MQVSESMKTKIKSYEGLCLKAYQLKGEKYYTIGYGHYGADVKSTAKITKEQADALFDKDIAVFDKYMHTKSICKYINELNQDMYDALLSFCYNCGPGNLQKLCNGNLLKDIPNAMLSYNKSNGKVLPGLTRRRKEEAELFKKGLNAKTTTKTDTRKTYTGQFPIGTMRIKARGQQVKYLQQFLNWYGNYNLTTDGMYGVNTQKAVKKFQTAEKLTVDGIWGNQCLSKAKTIKK